MNYLLIQSKLTILSAAAKYDVSCSSSGSTRQNKGGIGNAAHAGICHSWTADGRCVSLLKILFSNDCAFDCIYCVNRHSADVPRATFTPRELADLTIEFYRRNYIEGLFLSSAVVCNPDYTMEMLIQVLRILRNQYRFNGYIHTKAIPGADEGLIRQAGELSDRMSLNIELPSSKGLKLLAPQKKREAIVKPMTFIASEIQSRASSPKGNHSFVPAGQTTQLMVGATPDSDYSILRLSEGLYQKMALKRVYYSAYVPVVSNPLLPTLTAPPLTREHRLYQADWLLRFYQFSAAEILSPTRPFFDVDLDPKSDWALRNLHEFPIDVNTADYEMLLRVPGLGVRSARRIIAARRSQCITFDILKQFGVILKKARHFILCNGQYVGTPTDNETLIKRDLMSRKLLQSREKATQPQLSFFSLHPTLFDTEPQSGITGEL
jgi:putative DNA modification/repair radical SAM protein